MNLTTGPTERGLRRRIEREGTICLALFDSEKLSPKEIARLSSEAEKCGVAGILLGGSTSVDQLELVKVVAEVKKRTDLPVILFPGNITGVVPGADAILFSSLLNSDNPYFITEAQALGALLVRKYGLETIPTAYLIIGEGGSAGFVGRARGLPPDRPGFATMYSLAAKYMGMRMVYLEAGSGVTSHVPESIVTAVRKVYDGTIMVGGGITSHELALKLAMAGADILVVGTLVERGKFGTDLKRIVRAISEQRSNKRSEHVTSQ